MALFVLRKLILQTHMRSHPVGLDVWLFGQTHRLLPYFVCANSEGSGETARMRRLACAFAGRLCDKYHNLMSWLICRFVYILFEQQILDVAWMVLHLSLLLMGGPGRTGSGLFVSCAIPLLLKGLLFRTCWIVLWDPSPCVSFCRGYIRSFWMITNPEIPKVDAHFILYPILTKSCFSFFPFRC